MTLLRLAFQKHNRRLCKYHMVMQDFCKSGMKTGRMP